MNEKTTLIEFFRTKNMCAYALPHEFGWMGQVMYIDSQENAHWTHPPVGTYEDAIQQAVDYCLKELKL